MRALRVAEILNDDKKYEKIELYKTGFKQYSWFSADNECFAQLFSSIYDAEIYLMRSFCIAKGELKAKWAHL